MDKKREIENLQKELKETREFHIAAWNMYGSELCAGEMIKKEKALEDKIKALEEAT